MPSLTAVLILVSAFPHGAATTSGATVTYDNEVIGWIVPIERKTFLERRSPQRTESFTLIPGRDNGRPLHAGDKVRCEPGGRMKINIYGAETEIAGSEQWREIPHVPPPNDSVRRAIEQYGHRGGRTRPGGQEILSPAKESKVSLTAFVFRWVPRSGNIFLTVTNVTTGKQLWEMTKIRGDTGEFDSPEAKKRLTAFRDGGKIDILSLTIGGGGRGPASIKFQLLTADEETRVVAELRSIDTQTKGILRHLGRAAVFDKFGMSAQVAEEYGAALLLDPNNIYLLMNTVLAFEAIGDVQSVQKLKRKLPPGVNMAEH